MSRATSGRCAFRATLRRVLARLRRSAGSTKTSSPAVESATPSGDVDWSKLKVSDGQPDWMRPLPIDEMVRIMRAADEQRRVRDEALSNLVFVFTPHINPGRAAIQEGHHFPDGKNRIFLHPKHKNVIEGWQQSRDV